MFRERPCEPSLYKLASIGLDVMSAPYSKSITAQPANALVRPASPTCHTVRVGRAAPVPWRAPAMAVVMPLIGSQGSRRGWLCGPCAAAVARVRGPTGGGFTGKRVLPLVRRAIAVASAPRRCRCPSASILSF